MTQGLSPFSSDLTASVAALYRLAPDHVPPTLMVCHCPVCMTPETKAVIVATPVRDLPPDLIREYSNSAHGDPVDPDDLNALLPRYLDLIAQDIEVNWTSVGADLKRFGDARGKLPGFPAAGMEGELDRYARLLLLHFGALQATGADPVETPWSLLQTLAIGGWDPATLTGALDELFALPDLGRPALVAFLTDLAGSLRDGVFVRWALMRYKAELAPQLSAWIADLLSSDAVTEVLSDPALPDGVQVWIGALAGIRGEKGRVLIGA
jgi:hypothetical protein